MTEALMEMYYFSAIRDYLSSVFGVRVLRLLKPSQRREGWVGFDQGWVRSNLSDEDFYSQLSGALQEASPNFPRLYFGLFLQFKIVHIMRRRSKYTPAGIFSDYYRSELDLTRSAESGSIQHHLLVRLASIPGTMVAYACPMFFDLDAIYDPPDLSTLRCMPVSNATPLFNENERHFIATQRPDSTLGFWCSDPVQMKPVPFAKWIHDRQIDFTFMTGIEFIKFLESAVEICSHDIGHVQRRSRHPSSVLPKSLTIFEVMDEKEPID